jgi:hypothetical protein
MRPYPSRRFVDLEMNIGRFGNYPSAMFGRRYPSASGSAPAKMGGNMVISPMGCGFSLHMSIVNLIILLS